MSPRSFTSIMRQRWLISIGSTKRGLRYRRGLALDPNFTLSHFHASTPTDNPICLAQRARIAEGMRKAGLRQK